MQTQRQMKNFEDISNLQKGEVKEKIDDSAWDQLKPRTRRVASDVELQLLFKDGKQPLTTDGPLYLIKSTYCYVEYNMRGEPTYINKMKSVEGVKLQKKSSGRYKHEESPPDANRKLDLYVQRIKNENKLVVFQMLVPLYQDITRYCDRLKKKQLRSKSFPPLLIGLIVYQMWLLFVEYGRYVEIYIDMLDTIPFAINVFAMTSLAWYVYTEFVAEGYWLTAEVTEELEMLLNFEFIREGIGGIDKEKISIDRMFTVYHIIPYFSHVSMLDAINRKTRAVVSNLVNALKQRIMDLTFENTALQRRNENLQKKVSLLAQNLNEMKKEINSVARKYFIRGYELSHNSPYVEPEQPKLDKDFIMELIKIGAVLAFGLIFLFFALPQLISLTEGFAIPELSLGTKILAAIFGVGFILFCMIIIFRQATKSI